MRFESISFLLAFALAVSGCSQKQHERQVDTNSTMAPPIQVGNAINDSKADSVDTQQSGDSMAIWIKKAAKRPWTTHVSTLGFSVDLPDFLRDENSPGPNQLQIYNDTLEALNNINVIVSREDGGDMKALKTLYAKQSKGSDSSSFNQTTFDVWYRHCEIEGDPELDGYSRAALTQHGLFLMNIIFEPRFRTALHEIIPRIAASIR